MRSMTRSLPGPPSHVHPRRRMQTQTHQAILHWLLTRALQERRIADEEESTILLSKKRRPLGLDTCVWMWSRAVAPSFREGWTHILLAEVRCHRGQTLRAQDCYPIRAKSGVRTRGGSQSQEDEVRRHIPPYISTDSLRLLSLGRLTTPRVSTASPRTWALSAEMDEEYLLPETRETSLPSEKHLSLTTPNDLAYRAVHCVARPQLGNDGRQPRGVPCEHTRPYHPPRELDENDGTCPGLYAAAPGLRYRFWT